MYLVLTLQVHTSLQLFPKRRNNVSFSFQPLKGLLPIYVQYIIQFLKVMYLFLTLQVHPTLPSVFCETDSVFLRADT